MTGIPRRNLHRLGVVAALTVGCHAAPDPAPSLGRDVPATGRSCSAFRQVAADTVIDAVGDSWLQPMNHVAPEYPPQRRAAREHGEVRVSFVIDSTGRVLRDTRVVLTESHRDFGDAVCTVLPRLRFTAKEGARLPGHTLVVNMPFIFTLAF